MSVRGPLSELGQGRRQDLLKAAFLAAASLLVYTVTRTRHFGGDDTVFALVVQRWLEVGSIERAFFHPHHLLYNPLVALSSWLVRAVTGSVFVLDVGAALSATAAAAAVAGVYLVMRRVHVHDDVAVLASVVLAVSGGMWRYATRMEVYTLAAAGVVVWLAAMSNEKASWRKLATGFVAPWLGHLVLALLAAPGAWLQRRRPRALVSAILAGLVVPAALVAAFLAWLGGAKSVSTTFAIFVSPGTGRWLSVPDPVAALRALGQLVTVRSYHVLPVYPPWTMTLLDILGCLATLGITALVVWGLVVSVRGQSRLGVAATLGVASLVPLWLVWDVGNPEHAVAAGPLFAVLAALGASAIGRKEAVAVLTALAVTLLIVNGIGSVLLETQTYLSRSLLAADHVRNSVPEDGTLVAVGVDPELRLSLPHLGGRRVVDLTLLVHSARRAGASPQEALKRWLQLVSAADDPWLLEDPDSPQVVEWVGDLGISHDEWREVRRLWRLGRGVTLEADGVVFHHPLTLRRLEVHPRRPPEHQQSPTGRVGADGDSALADTIAGESKQ